MAQAVRSHLHTGARVVCVIREHHTTFGRGRLWVGRPARGDRESVACLTPALVAEAVRMLRVAVTTLKPARPPLTDPEGTAQPHVDQDLPRIQSLLADGIVVIASSSGAGPVQHASALDAKLVKFDSGQAGTWERPTRPSHTRGARRDAVTKPE